MRTLLFTQPRRWSSAVAVAAIATVTAGLVTLAQSPVSAQSSSANPAATATPTPDPYGPPPSAAKWNYLCNYAGTVGTINVGLSATVSGAAEVSGQGYVVTNPWLFLDGSLLDALRGEGVTAVKAALTPAVTPPMYVFSAATSAAALPQPGQGLVLQAPITSPQPAYLVGPLDSGIVFTANQLALTVQTQSAAGTWSDAPVSGCVAPPGTNNVLATLGSMPTPTPVVPPTPTPTPQPTSGHYTVTGTTKLASSTSTSPISGSVDLVSGPGGQMTGQLSLTAPTTRFTLFGFLPLQADIQFTPFESYAHVDSGSLSLGGLMFAKVRAVTLFGFFPIAGGSDCGSVGPASMGLTSTAGGFSFTTGGMLAGTYQIAPLNGNCGLFGSLISNAMTGSGNTLSVKLTPKG